MLILLVGSLLITLFTQKDTRAKKQLKTSVNTDVSATQTSYQEMTEKSAEQRISETHNAASIRLPNNFDNNGEF